MTHDLVQLPSEPAGKPSVPTNVTFCGAAAPVIIIMIVAEFSVKLRILNFPSNTCVYNFSPVDVIFYMKLSENLSGQGLQNGSLIMAEWTYAAALALIFKLGQTDRQMRGCAWSDGANNSCPYYSQFGEHRTLSNMTLGIIGYGQIGCV